jgi:hypothetical protein
MSLTSLSASQVAEQLKENGQCLIRTDVDKTKPRILYKVSRGDKGKLFTLWLIHPDAAEDEKGQFYVRRLGNEYEKALKLAAEIALDHADKAPGVWLEIFKHVSSVKPIKQSKAAPADVFPFGKYNGLTFGEVSDNAYKEWLLPVLADKGRKYERTYRALRDNMLENGFKERDGGLVSPETLEKEDERKKGREQTLALWESLRENSRFLDVPVGANVDFFRAYLLSETSFESAFGRVFIQVFRDDEERVFVYKGSGRAIEAVRGETFYVRGKVKDFTTYNGICQTQLTRLTVLDKRGPRLIGETAARRAKSDGYRDMREALENPEFVDELIEDAQTLGGLPKKDKAFARSVIKEVLGDASLGQ